MFIYKYRNLITSGLKFGKYCSTTAAAQLSSSQLSLPNKSILLYKESILHVNRLLGRQISTVMSPEKPKVVFVLGGPGAGKGTQCQKIVDHFGFVHLSAGDLLREERAREGSEFGELIEECIVNGKIVPVAVTCSLLENAMNKNMKEQSKYKFLIDGFPRNQDNLDGWNDKMSAKVNLLFILYFDCSEDICVERCLSRGAAGSGRSDDNLESLKKRVQTFQNDSLPIIEHYKALDLVRAIDASPSSDKVFEKVQEAFNACKL